MAQQIGGGAHLGPNGEVIVSAPDRATGEMKDWQMVDGQWVEFNFTPAATPAPVATTPAATPVSASGYTTAATLTPSAVAGGGSPAATGFPLFRESFNMMLEADAARRAAVDQQINFTRMFSELTAADPVTAADLAVRLGLPEPNIGFLNRLGKGAMTTFGGQAGTQQVNLPFSFSRNQLQFLDTNKVVQNIVQSAATRFGRPDVLNQSIAGMVPTSSITRMFGFA